MAYTALARMAAGAGRPDDAYAAAQELLAAKSLPARLRAFVPALQGYCAAGQVDKAFQACPRMGLLGFSCILGLPRTWARGQ